MSDSWKKAETTFDAHDFNTNPVLEGVLIDKHSEVGENKSWLYIFRKADGTEVSMWGSTILDDLMKQVSVGQEARVTFIGVKKNKTNNRETKHFEVEYRDAPMKKAEASGPDL